MKKFFFFYREFKIFAIIDLTFGLAAISLSILGHIIRRGNLIPFVMVGGTLGILTGTYYLLKKSLIKKENVIAVAICSLISFGIASLIAIFNFDKPSLIFICFLFIGFTAAFSNWYFQKHNYISESLKYGLLGFVLILPSFYFIISSILKFKIKINGPFNFIEGLLSHPNGQANLNAISPFIFGGGLALAFFVNLFAQMQLIKSETALLKSRLTWKKYLPLNLTVMMMSCSLGSVLLTYLMLENL
jgi:hypothetical protein